MAALHFEAPTFLDLIWQPIFDLATRPREVFFDPKEASHRPAELRNFSQEIVLMFRVAQAPAQEKKNLTEHL